MKGTLEYYLIKLGIGLISKEEFMNQILKKHEETKKQEEERFNNLLNKHRKESFLTCSENCFCWDIEKELEQEE